MFDHFFITGHLPNNIIRGEYIPLLVIISYIVASVGSFTGLALAGRISKTNSLREKRKLHIAGAVSLGSGIWSMHFIGMLAYDMKMAHNYNPWLTVFSGIVAIAVAWFVLKITQAESLSWKRLSISAVLLGFGIATMHYVGMEAMQMDANLQYLPGLFFLSIIIAIVASGAALWIIFTLGQHISRNQTWRIIAALVMGVAICGMHYTGMAAAVIIPFADCRFEVTQPFSILGMSVIATTGSIFIISLLLGVANRLAALVACGAIFSLPLIAIVYQAVSGLNSDINFTKREQQGIVYHEEMIDLLISLQKLRDITNIEMHSKRFDENTIKSQQKDALSWIAKVEAADKLYGKQLGVQEDWSNIKNSFNHILEEHGPGEHKDADFEFAAHTKIINDFIAFMETVVDKSNLNTDPDPDSNLIADVLYNLTPETLEILAEMRGFASGYLAESPKKWTNVDFEKLRKLYNQLQMLDGLIENRLIRSTQIIPKSQRFVEYHQTIIHPQIEEFMVRYQEMILNRKTNWSSQTLFDDATKIIESYDVLYDQMINGFSNVLEKRQENYAIKQNVVLLSCTLGLLGFVALFIFLFRSLTKTERAEHNARHAKRTAEQAAAAKSDFLANMSHELRTPMNGVLGMAHLLADTELNEEQKQYVSTINGSGENLLILLNDILDFSKIEAGALALENIAYNLKEDINGAINLLRPQADKKAIDLQVECEPEVPDYVWGDPGRIRQIIINLVGNSIKFTEGGYVRLTARLQERDTGSHLHISIEDTGVGIPADKLDKIFDKFTQADASVTRKFGGTGLGLAITRQLIALMHGQIGVESVEGKGSTFWFVIPCKAASEKDLNTASENKVTHINTKNLRPLAEAKILLVEDYEVNQVFAEKLLRKFGATQIEIAENGNEAITKYRTGTYDMIFMDCQMPELDGYQATGKIRLIEDGTKIHTPIIAMTANAMMGDREKCLKAGMDDYLSKPLRANHLKNILETWFILDASKAVITKSPVIMPKEAEEAPVDMDQLRIFTDGDLQEEKELTTLFIEQAHAMIDILSKSTGDDEMEAWRSAAHRFKGSSGNLGATKLHHLCKHAELHFEDIEAKKLEMLAAIKAETARVEIFFTNP